jgi:hypothetical protein
MNGSWKDLTETKKNSSADISPTTRTNAKIIRTCAGIKIYRQVKGIPNKANFSVEGNEIAWELLETQVPQRDCFLKLLMLQVYYKYLSN